MDFLNETSESWSGGQQHLGFFREEPVSKILNEATSVMTATPEDCPPLLYVQQGEQD